MLSQHSVLVTRKVNRRLGLECPGTISPVIPDLIRSAFLRSTLASVPANGVGHVVKKVPSHRRADPVRWNRAMADSTAASATRLAESK